MALTALIPVYSIIGEFYSRKPGVNSVLLFSFALIEAVFYNNNNTRFITPLIYTNIIGNAEHKAGDLQG